jgi:hypothetical protein
VYGSLPALTQFTYTRKDDTGLKNFFLKHGHKLHELELLIFHGSYIFDMCPALNVLTFSTRTMVRPVDLIPLFHLLILIAFDSMMDLLVFIASRNI